MLSAQDRQQWSGMLYDPFAVGRNEKETVKANDSLHDFDNVVDQVVMDHEVVKLLLFEPTVTKRLAMV